MKKQVWFLNRYSVLRDSWRSLDCEKHSWNSEAKEDYQFNPVGATDERAPVPTN